MEQIPLLEIIYNDNPEFPLNSGWSDTWDPHGCTLQHCVSNTKHAKKQPLAKTNENELIVYFNQAKLAIILVKCQFILLPIIYPKIMVLSVSPER